MDEFCFCRQERMEELLCDAALSGNLQSLREIIAKDSYILDKVLVGCFKGKNPLHLATSTGQAEFVKKLLEIKPKLAEVVDTELGTALHIASANGDSQIVEALVKHSPEMCMARDRDGNNPLHIASANGHLKIVEALVKVNPEMCMARDRGGNNPLHIAAMADKVDVLRKLVQTCPRAALVVLERGDTILHLCVNYNQLESLKVLVDMIKDPDFVHSKDANGNTILHVAVFGKHVEIIGFVLKHEDIKINVNAINGAGWSAMDIYFFVQNRPHRGEVDMAIEDLLREAKAKGREQMTVFTPTPRGKELMQTLMVVASLFATMAFQVGVNPPGSVWQENTHGHRAGEAILASKYPLSYACFVYFNTVGFLLSLASILFLLMVALPLPKSAEGWILPGMSFSAIMATAFAYTYSVVAVSPKTMMAGALIYVILGSVILWASLALLVAIPFVGIHELSRRKDKLKIKKLIYGYSDRPVFDLHQCLVSCMKSPHAIVNNVSNA